MVFTIKTNSLDEFVAKVEEKGAKYVEARINEDGVDRRMPLLERMIYAVPGILSCHSVNVFPDPKFYVHYVAKTPVVHRKIIYEEEYGLVPSKNRDPERFERGSSMLVATAGEGLKEIEGRLPETETSIVGLGGTLD